MNSMPEMLQHMNVVANLAPCGVGLYELETTRPVLLNRAYYELIGYTEEEYSEITHFSKRVLYPEDAAILEQLRLNTDKPEYLKGFECRLVRKDGKTCWVKIDASVLHIEEIDYIFATFTDITTEKVAHARVNLIAENTINALSITELRGGEKQLLYGNGRFYDLMGFDPAAPENVHHTFNADLVSPQDYRRLQDAVDHAVENPGELQTIEHQLCKPDGDIRWVEVRFRTIMQEADTYFVVAVATDITEKKLADLKIAMEQNRIQMVIEEMNAAIFEWNLNTHAFYSSSAYQKYALSKMDSEIIRNNADTMDLVHPDDREALRVFFADTNSGKERTETLLRLKMTEGGYHWCRMLSFFFKNADGVPTNTLGVIIDVNEEHEHSFMLDNLLNELPGGVGIFTLADTLKCDYYSDGFATLSGRSREEIDQMLRDNTALAALISPLDYSNMLSILREQTSQGLPLNMNFRFFHKDGSIRWAHLTGKALREIDGCPVYYCIVTHPTAEAALYQGVIEDSPVGVFIAERATRTILYWNDAADRLCGYPLGHKKTGLTVEETCAECGLNPLFTQEQIEALSTEQYTEYHVEQLGLFLMVKAKALNWNGVDSYILYITDETAEHTRQLQLQNLIDEVPGGIGVYDIEDGEVCLSYLNSAYYEMLGTKREDRLQFWGKNVMNAVHPEDRPMMESLVAEVVEGKNRMGALHRVKNSKGEWTWLDMEGSVVLRSTDYIRVYAAFSNCDELVLAQQKMLDLHKRQQALLASMPGAVATYRLKKDGRFVFDYVSESLAKMCGYTDFDEFHGLFKDDATLAIWDEDIPALMQKAQECLQNRTSLSAVYRIRTKAGSTLLNRLDAYLVNDGNLEEEDVALWYAVHTVVSEESQRAMAEQQRYRSLMNALDMVVVEWDKESGFYASDKYQNYALSEQEPTDILLNRIGEAAVHPDDLPALKEFLLLGRQSRSRHATVLRMKMKDGTYRWTELLGFYEFGADGLLTRLIGVLRDIDKERIEETKRLRMALAEAKHANQAKSAFLSRVSHDMRTPLNGILGMTALIKDISADPKITQSLSQVEMSGRYLLNLINDTLDVSCLESGKLELHPTVCDSRVVFDTIRRMIAPSIKTKGIRFDLNTENLPFTYIYVDEGRLQQIAMNILGNAIKFTPGGGMISVTAKNLSVTEGLVTDQFVIEDNGCGMSREFLPRLFEAFSQEDTATTNSNQGTGLGMSIVKRLVELMNSEITVESKRGTGTRINLILRLPIATNEQLNEWRKAFHTGNSDCGLAGKNILLCEDHPLNARIAIRLLEKKGVHVEHAENGKAGLDIFRASKEGFYDAILMDLRMPILDGLDATRAIRALQRPDARVIPIIAVTANSLPEDIRHTREVGMDAHISKPIDPERLYGTLEQLINANPQSHRQRVLIVDDVDVNRAVIRAALEPVYAVFEADSGAAALEMLRQHHGMDAVVTDIRMPDMDGAELIRLIRNNDDYRHMVVIANTQYENPGMEEMLLSIGVNDFIYKPASPNIIQLRIRNALNRR